MRRMTGKVWPDREKGVRTGILYAVLVLALGAYFNFSATYDANPAVYPQASQLVLWALLYVPLGLMVAVGGWNVADFGFSIRPVLGLATVIVVFLCGAAVWSIQIPWQYAFLEAFARTGEEIFFRGFLFALLLKIFSGKPRPWIGAVLLSAVLFAGVHTQTFQPAYLESLGTGPTLYKISERLLNLFLIGSFLALLRQGTKSILPGAVLHSLIQGGIVTLPFSLGICGLITLLALARKEPILAGDGHQQAL